MLCRLAVKRLVNVLELVLKDGVQTPLFACLGCARSSVRQLAWQHDSYPVKQSTIKQWGMAMSMTPLPAKAKEWGERKANSSLTVLNRACAGWCGSARPRWRITPSRHFTYYFLHLLCQDDGSNARLSNRKLISCLTAAPPRY